MAALHRPALPLPGRFAVPRLFPRRLSWRTTMMLAAMLVLGIAVVQVNEYSRLTSTGYQINQLMAERASKEADNHALEAQVASLSSLARVDWEARTRLHMQPPKQTLYIDVNGPAPDHQTLPTRYLPPEPPPTPAATRHTSLWKRILGLLPGF
jgi:cell division protein FtsL